MTKEQQVRKDIIQLMKGKPREAVIRFAVKQQIIINQLRSLDIAEYPEDNACPNCSVKVDQNHDAYRCAACGKKLTWIKGENDNDSDPLSLLQTLE